MRTSLPSLLAILHEAVESDATGVRIRELPLSSRRVKAALGA